MLSRVADGLYWMSRYLERAEHTARLLDLNLNQMLDQTPAGGAQRWQRVLASLRLHYDGDLTDIYRLTNYLTFDSSNRSSIVACISAARENARQVREEISSEMWEHLNRLYLLIKSTRMDDMWSTEPHEFYRTVKEGAHLFQGITDSTLTHDEGWQFIQLGRSLERADAIALLLDVHFDAHPLAPNDATLIDDAEWVGLLKSCTAFEAYCKTYTADVQPARVTEFLLLSDAFPHSLRFTADAIQASLRAISRTTGARNASRPERLAGRLCASLDYAQIDELLADDLHMYLESIKQQCAQVHNTVQQIYIAYPIDASLVA